MPVTRSLPGPIKNALMVGALAGTGLVGGCARPNAPPPRQPHVMPFNPAPPVRAEAAPLHPGSRPVAAPVFLGAGVASYYADMLAGRPTASGEPYLPAQLTAAHRTLPFGTRVLVRKAGGEGSVIVRINDRGPFVRGRVIDLSRQAAETLGMIRAGVAPVELWLLPPATTE